jgi:dihydropteroate synthase
MTGTKASLQSPRLTLEPDQRTHIMGVLNVTPDSFSDGGQYFQLEKAVQHGLQMAREGADIIDIGGESTRPYSRPVSAEEEAERVIPVIEALVRESGIAVSIDTRKAEVARKALEAGATMINDISALRFDASLAAVAAEAQVPVILMHMQGTPENMQLKPVYHDLMGEIEAFLQEAVERALKAGIRRENIILDPGIGFGKTFDHNLQIIRDLSRLGKLEQPILVGSSRKAFIGHILDKTPDQRDIGSLATVACAVMAGAHIVRVHNVRWALETVGIVDAIKRGTVEAQRN